MTARAAAIVVLIFALVLHGCAVSSFAQSSHADPSFVDAASSTEVTSSTVGSTTRHLLSTPTSCSDAPPLPLGAHGGTCGTSNVPIGGDCSFACPSGFVLQGSAFLVCGVNGQWIGTQSCVWWISSGLFSYTGGLSFHDGTAVALSVSESGGSWAISASRVAQNQLLWSSFGDGLSFGTNIHSVSQLSVECAASSAAGVPCTPSASFLALGDQDRVMLVSFDPIGSTALQPTLKFWSLPNGVSSSTAFPFQLPLAAVGPINSLSTSLSVVATATGIYLSFSTTLDLPSLGVTLTGTSAAVVVQLHFDMTIGWTQVIQCPYYAVTAPRLTALGGAVHLAGTTVCPLADQVYTNLGNGVGFVASLNTTTGSVAWLRMSPLIGRVASLQSDFEHRGVFVKFPGGVVALSKTGRLLPFDMGFNAQFVRVLPPSQIFWSATVIGPSGLEHFVHWAPVVDLSPMNTDSDDQSAIRVAAANTITVRMKHFVTPLAATSDQEGLTVCFFMSDGTLPCSLCSPGQSWNGTACNVVSAGQYANFFNPVTLCPAAYYCPQGSAAPILCSEGSVCFSTGNVAPMSCPGGYYCSGAGKQAPSGFCVAGQVCAPGAAAPIPCPAGSYCPQSLMSNATICPLHFYCPTTGLTAPLPCPPGSRCFTTGVIDPQGCSAGRFCNVTDSAESYPCLAGSFCPSGSAHPTPCAAGSVCASDLMTAPLPCPAGFACSETGTVIPTQCDPGTYSAASSVSCTPCGVGTYCAAPGMTAPTTCPTGSICAATGLVQPTLCPGGWRCSSSGLSKPTAECLAGFSCNNGTITPVACPRGSMCPTNGMSAPIACAAGFYCASSQAVSQTLCDPGSVCPDTGMSSPIPCALGCSCSSPGLQQPHPCEPGFVCPSPTLPPQLCPSASFCPDWNMTVALGCPVGMVCAGLGVTQPTACSGGSYASASNDRCVLASAGTYVPAGMRLTNALACVPGSYCASAGLDAPTAVCPPASFCPSGSTVPTACSPGGYCPNANASAPTPAPPGYYCPLTGMLFPYLCPPGFTCPSAGLSQPVACLLGSNCSLGGIDLNTLDPAIACPAGLWCASVTAEPQLCTVGFYCPSGTTFPRACPLSTYCPSGNMSSPLPCAAGFFCGSLSATSMTPCTAGHTCPASGLSAPGPPCSPGVFCPLGSVSPITCSIGSTCPFFGMAVPIPCAAGTVCASAGMSTATGAPCSVGSYCPQGAQAETPCPVGAFCNATGLAAPIPCPPSYMCGATRLVLPQALCPSGSFCSGGNAVEQPCPVNYFCPFAGLTEPRPCPVGMLCLAEGTINPAVILHVSTTLLPLTGGVNVTMLVSADLPASVTELPLWFGQQVQSALQFDSEPKVFLRVPITEQNGLTRLLRGAFKSSSLSGVSAFSALSPILSTPTTLSIGVEDVSAGTATAGSPVLAVSATATSSPHVLELVSVDSWLQHSSMTSTAEAQAWSPTDLAASSSVWDNASFVTNVQQLGGVPGSVSSDVTAASQRAMIIASVLGVSASFFIVFLLGAIARWRQWDLRALDQIRFDEVLIGPAPSSPVYKWTPPSGSKMKPRSSVALSASPSATARPHRAGLVVRHQTQRGAFLSILLLLLLLTATAVYLLGVLMDNSTSVIALSSPLTQSRGGVSLTRSNYGATLQLAMFQADCVVDSTSSALCSPHLALAATGFDSAGSWQCSLDVTRSLCTARWTCDDCSLTGASALLQLSSAEPNAFSSRAQFSISSVSPDGSQSAVVGSLDTRPYSFIRGSPLPTWTVTATPSSYTYFTDEPKLGVLMSADILLPFSQLQPNAFGSASGTGMGVMLQHNPNVLSVTVQARQSILLILVQLITVITAVWAMGPILLKAAESIKPASVKPVPVAPLLHLPLSPLVDRDLSQASPRSDSPAQDDGDGVRIDHVRVHFQSQVGDGDSATIMSPRDSPISPSQLATRSPRTPGLNVSHPPPSPSVDGRPLRSTLSLRLPAGPRKPTASLSPMMYMNAPQIKGDSTVELSEAARGGSDVGERS